MYSALQELDLDSDRAIVIEKASFGKAVYACMSGRSYQERWPVKMRKGRKVQKFSVSAKYDRPWCDLFADKAMMFGIRDGRELKHQPHELGLAKTKTRNCWTNPPVGIKAMWSWTFQDSSCSRVW